MAEVFNSPPTFTANQWENKGRFYEVLGKEIFIIEKGDHEECLFILHGYLTSSYDYYKVLDALAEKYRVVIPDIFGFGLSEKNANHYTTIITQVDYLVELCKQMGLQQISILSHDFGIALGQELLTRDNAGLLNIDIKEFIYCNGILPIKNSYFLDIKDYVKKEVATKIITMLTTSGFFKKNIKELFYDENNITEEELEQMWYLVDCNNGRSLVKFIYNYLKERNIAFTRWTTAIIETVVPIKVIWGIKNESEKDDYPESLIYKVEKKNVCWIEKSGHFPMLENPKEFVEVVFK